jgi:hypothetical protein
MLTTLLGTILSCLADFLSKWLTSLRRDQDLRDLGARQEAAQETAVAATAAAEARQIEQDDAAAPIDPAIFRKDFL